MSSGYGRVSKRRPCRVCGSETWCSFTLDEQVSICMWESKGSTRPTSHGGFVHIHRDVDSTAPVRSPKPAPPTIATAPIEIRDAVYRELIRISPASTFYPSLVSGPDGLLARGLAKSEIDRYGALPPLPQQRARLARQLCAFVAKEFPNYSRQHSGNGIIGVPGFWLDSDSQPQIWKERNYQMPLLVIPYKNAQGRIQACQMRLHKADIPEGQRRYRWLSSPFEPKGCSSGTPIHFTFDPKSLPAGSTVVITEGALKADVFAYLRPAARMIATSGVACSHEQLIEASAPYHAFIAFDADHRTNPHVCRQLARLIAARELYNRKHNPSLTTRIVDWQGYKGIDDAAMNSLVKFKTVSIREWINTLIDQSKNDVLKLWNDLEFNPPNDQVIEQTNNPLPCSTTSQRTPSLSHPTPAIKAHILADGPAHTFNDLR